MSAATSLPETRCATVREVLQRVGDKWSVLVIHRLGNWPRRYSEIRRSINGTSQRMLTRTLRQIGRDGPVIRAVYPSNPPQVSYGHSSLGRTLLKPVKLLGDWAETHMVTSMLRE